MKANYILLSMIAAISLLIFVQFQTASFIVPLSDPLLTKSQISIESDRLLGKLLSSKQPYTRKWIHYEKVSGIDQLTPEQITQFFGNSKRLLELGLIFWSIRYENVGSFKEIHLRINPYGKWVGYKIIPRTGTDSGSQLNLTLSQIKNLGLLTNWKIPPGKISDGSLHFSPNESFKDKGELSLFVDRKGHFITEVRSDYTAPSQWTEALSPKLFTGQLLSGIGFLSYSFASLAGLVLIGIALSRQRISSSKLWISLILTGSIFMGNYLYMANNFPNYLRAWDPEISLFAYACFLFIGMIPGSIMTALLFFSAFLSGWSLKTTRIALSKHFNLHPVAVIWGTCFLWLGIISLLYQAGKTYFGVTMLANIPTDVFNPYWPMLNIVIMALLAGLIEETVYRLMLTPLLNKVINNYWISAFIISGIWALLHTQYAIFPVYFRVIELLPLGMIFSWIFYHYGWWPCVLAHFLIDLYLMGSALLPRLDILDWSTFWLSQILLILLIHLFREKAKRWLP